MAHYLLQNIHSPAECEASFAAWHGFDSPLRGNPTQSTCLAGGHRIWWTVEAASESEALALLPAYVAERTELIRVRDVAIP